MLEDRSHDGKPDDAPAGDRPATGGRLSSCPSISLEKAVALARALYGKARHHPVGLPMLADAWNGRPRSGAFARTIAALVAFGLMTDEGAGKARKFQLTDDALRIIQDSDPMSPKRIAALRRAALAPMIHAELYGRFGGLPETDDSKLAAFLAGEERDKGPFVLGEDAARDAVATYRVSLDYAGLATSEGGRDFDADRYHAADDEGDGFGPAAKAPHVWRRRRPGAPALLGDGRELAAGILSPDASFRLTVRGHVGVREIDRLIRRLEFDRMILSEIETDRNQRGARDAATRPDDD